MKPPPVPTVLAIAGCSGSGKTTLAGELATQLDATLFPLDLYYRDLSQFPLDTRHQRNFDHPDSLESELIIGHIRALAAEWRDPLIRLRRCLFSAPANKRQKGTALRPSLPQNSLFFVGAYALTKPGD